MPSVFAPDHREEEKALHIQLKEESEDEEIRYRSQESKRRKERKVTDTKIQIMLEDQGMMSQEQPVSSQKQVEVQKAIKVGPEMIYLISQMFKKFEYKGYQVDPEKMKMDSKIG